MAHYKMESGYQLFARLNSRPTLENIYPNIFGNNGPRGREVIEIFGDTSTGKTLIITELIAYCILPGEANNTRIGGKNAGAILINTDHHFHIFKLAEIMENIIKKYSRDSNTTLSKTEITNIIKVSLKKLIILNCFDSYQLHATILNLENIIADNNKLTLIVLDSLSAYYWSDRLNSGIKSMDLYQKSVLKSLQVKVKDYNLTIVFTKYSGFSRKDSSEECVTHPILEKVNYKVFLENSADKNTYQANITFPDNTKITKKYRIQNLVEWFDE